MKLEGLNAVVTGASRGIGKSIAMRLAQEGACVIGTATTAEGAAVVEEGLAPWKGFGRILDVTTSEGLDEWVREVGTVVGPVSILINNAGITRDTLLMRMKEEDWTAVINANLTGVFRLSRAFVPTMLRARFGRIISIGSVVAAMGNPGQANYGAAKAGLAGFSRSLAREIGSRGITVNVVAPGFIETDMTHALDQRTRDYLLGQIPAGRLGTADDVSAAVAFLASREASYINGVTLDVNGGMHMS